MPFVENRPSGFKESIGTGATLIFIDHFNSMVCNNKISIMIEIENWQRNKTISYFLCLNLPVSFACGE